MNSMRFIASCMLIALLLPLSGCTKKSGYKPQQLKSLKKATHLDYQETKAHVTLCAKVFAKFDLDTIFGERADRIIADKDPLQPI